MKLFIEYLKSKKNPIIVFLFFVVIFVISFMLYRIPITPLIYPITVCSLFSLLFLTIDFLSVKKRHNTLCKIKGMTSQMIDNLPTVKTVCEQDYKEIIMLQKEEIKNIKSDDFKKYNDMVEYYTVWAHQIKTPISSMKLTLQNIDSDISRRLSADLFRTQSYVDMVLAFLRIGSESNDYLFKSYDIDEIIKPSVRKFASEFIGRKLSLKYEPLCKKIITDEKWFAFVIEQLLSNALKYTKSGEISIYMKDENTLCITDTGIGIAPEDLPRIFEKGYTGYNGRTDKTASGLGLYLCKRVCDSLKLGLSITSILGKGTSVSIKFSQNKIFFD